MTHYSTPSTGDEMREIISSIEQKDGYQRPVAFALGLATVEGEGSDTQVLDVTYTRRNYAENFGTAAVLAAAFDVEDDGGLSTGQYLFNYSSTIRALRMFSPIRTEPGHGNVTTLKLIKNKFGDLDQDSLGRGEDPDKRKTGIVNKRVPVLGVIADWDDDPVSVADTYLRLYALSDRHRQPNTINLDGIFKHLANLVMTENLGSFTPNRWDEVAEHAIFRGLSTNVRVLDKFPRMADHVIPSGVRIADPSRVRLGAHLGSGTTVMHEGFSNFNAGTLGESMVEGRISAGVVVGEGSDVGGGASTQGTLSGGGEEIISIGQRTLLEANSGTGISLGDDCRIEAGFYVKGTTPVRLPSGDFVKAATLSGKDNMLIRRNSQDGVVELVPNIGQEWGGLNTDLHSNQ